MSIDFTRTPSRRRFLQHAFGAMSLATLGCTPSARTRRRLRIFVYAGGHEETMRQVFLPLFEAATGCEVILDSGWWDAIAKLKTSPTNDPAYDLVITDATQGYSAIKAGMFQQLDLTKLPNVNQLAASVLDHWVWKDRYAVPYPDSVMTLAYHRQAIPFTPTNWADLLKPEIKGRVGLYDAYYMSLYTFACMMVAQAGKHGSAHAAIETQLQAVMRFARDHRDQVGYWWPTSTAFGVQLVQKQYAIGNMHSPEMLQELVAHPELGAVVPTEDRAFVQVMWAIPTGTPQADLAHEAINVLFSEPVQLGFAQRGSATGLLSVAKSMAMDAKWAAFYPSDEAGLKAIRYYPYDVYAQHAEEITTFWDREILRKARS